MSLADKTLSIAFTEGKKQTPATIVYNGDSVTGVFGYIQSEVRDMEDAGFQKAYSDVTVILKSSDISTWNVKRDLEVGLIGGNISGSMAVRDPIRYLGSQSQYTWLVLDILY